jgi:hypothetical protein
MFNNLFRLFRSKNDKLAEKAINTSDYNQGLKSLNKITDQSKIAEVARMACTSEVNLAALKMLTDQSEIAMVAVVPCNSAVNLAALKMLTDQSIIAEVVYHARYDEVILAALKMLSDQSIIDNLNHTFVENAMNTYDHDKGLRLLKMINNQSEIAKIAKNPYTKSFELRLSAVRMLTDLSLLDEIAKFETGYDSSASYVRDLACARLKKLKDTDASDASVRYAALEKVIDQTTLAGW